MCYISLTIFGNEDVLNIPHCLRKWRYAISLTTCVRCIISLVVYGKEWCTISFNLQETCVVLCLTVCRKRRFAISLTVYGNVTCTISLTVCHSLRKLYVALFIYPTVYRKGRCSISLTVHKKQRCSISLTVYWKRRCSQFTDN